MASAGLANSLLPPPENRLRVTHQGAGCDLQLLPVVIVEKLYDIFGLKPE
ncbi:hypothetical protein [Marinimicrobium locisalis]